MPERPHIDLAHFSDPQVIEQINQLSANDKLEVIRNYCQGIRSAIHISRILEVQGNQPDQFRNTHLYYEFARSLAEAEDYWFSELFPAEYEALMQQTRDLSTRWQQAQDAAQAINTVISNQGIPGILDCRAKSLFGLFEKINKYGIGISETFDQHGVRVVVPTEEYRIKAQEAITATFPLMPTHEFSNPKLGLHHPTRMVTKDNGYSALHMNVIVSGNIVEVQIQTFEEFESLHTATAYPLETIIHK